MHLNKCASITNTSTIVLSLWKYGDYHYESMEKKQNAQWNSYKKIENDENKET